MIRELQVALFASVGQNHFKKNNRSNKQVHVHSFTSIMIHRETERGKSS